MASLNKVLIIGNLGKDPETKYLPSGDAVTSVSIATADRWKDKASGEMKEATEWHRVSFFGRLAEIAGEYLTKGSQVYIEGRIKTRKWQDGDGKDRYSTEIVADKMLMLGGKVKDAEGEHGATRREPDPEATPQPGGFEKMSDDIPFAPIGRGISGHAI